MRVGKLFVVLVLVLGLLPLAAVASDPPTVETIENAADAPGIPAVALGEWSMPEAVLWDNGPLVTHPGACSGQDASRLQTGLAMNTLGFGHQFLYNYRMADDFEVTDPGGWQIDQITFFAYQTSAPSNPSPITGVYFQIWDGSPDDPGSTVVFGDLVTNRLASSTFSNIQRDSETSPCANNRYIFADEATAGVILPQGTYWLEWMTDGSLSSGPWAPPITITGQTTTGNALQYTTAWAAALDSGTGTQQGMPFIIEGSVAGGTGWYEDWDSYPTGQSMHGVGGWKGWGNDPAWTAYTTDVQNLSAPNSIDISANADLVHEYDMDAGVWTYTAWQYIPTDFAGESYFILLNQYDDAGVNLNWSVQIDFDSGSNMVINDGPAGGTLPMIKGDWVELRVEIDLDADWQQFYYGGDLLFEGSWSEGMSGGGITSIGAVDLFANGASPVYYDDLSLVEAGAADTMHVGGIKGRPYAASILKAWVLVEDQDLMPLDGAEVYASVWAPNWGPRPVMRMTMANGLARFAWGSMASGTWTLCVDDIVLAGYTYVPGDNVVTCMDWVY